MEPVVLLLFFAVAWLLLIRPQQQRLRAQRALIDSLAVGDQVVTAGGIIGTITRLDERDAWIQVAPGVDLQFLRAAMSRRLSEAGAGAGGADGAEATEHGADGPVGEEEA